jgi:hypothetical protein
MPANAQHSACPRLVSMSCSDAGLPPAVGGSGLQTVVDIAAAAWPVAGDKCGGAATWPVWALNRACGGWACGDGWFGWAQQPQADRVQRPCMGPGPTPLSPGCSCARCGAVGSSRCRPCLEKPAILRLCTALGPHGGLLAANNIGGYSTPRAADCLQHPGVQMCLSSMLLVCLEPSCCGCWLQLHVSLAHWTSWSPG